MRGRASLAERAGRALEHRRSERETKRQKDVRLKWGTRVFGAVSVTAVGVLIVAEAGRIWRLGQLPLTHGDERRDLVNGRLRQVRLLREGYRVSSTRENALVNMVTAFVITFGITRGITHTIRTRGSLGPIKNIQTSGGRHIHHFIPGAVVSLAAGGVAIASRPEGANRWLAIPFGIGIALVLDETALLLELEDVYWSEEGVLSVQIAFATMGLLGAVAYAIQVRRRGQPGAETDWRQAAKAWEDLELVGRGGRRETGDGTSVD